MSTNNKEVNSIPRIHEWTHVYGVYDGDQNDYVHVAKYPNWTVARREYFRLLWDPKTYGQFPQLARNIFICDAETGDKVSLLDLATSFGVKFGVSDNEGHQ